MVRALILAALAFTLAACSSNPPVTDFSNRSIVYSWIDTSGVPGNRMTYFEMRNLMEPANQRHYPFGVRRMGRGFLVWHAGVNPGRYEYSQANLMSCAGPLCTNQVNEFDFGPLGTAPGQVRIDAPGVYFAGCTAMKRTRRGFFRPGQFDTGPVPCGVSRQAMLQQMLADAPTEHPIVAQRIRAAMR